MYFDYFSAFPTTNEPVSPVIYTFYTNKQLATLEKVADCITIRGKQD